MGVLVVVVIVIVAYWLIERHLHPTRRCPRCGGSKRNFGSNEIRWGTCRRCDGKGEVPRRGIR
jgi:DnaJ-class molecular chaperone